MPPFILQVAKLKPGAKVQLMGTPEAPARVGSELELSFPIACHLSGQRAESSRGEGRLRGGSVSGREGEDLEREVWALAKRSVPFLQPREACRNVMLRKVEIPPAGIKNLGNTCYMNATLQCLNRVGDLREALNHYQPPGTEACQ